MSSLFSHNDVMSALNSETIGFQNGAVDRIVIDSRVCGTGVLFIPLVGEVTDGHLFIESVLKHGCTASLVSSDYYSRNQRQIELYATDYGCTFFIVNNVLTALHRLAAVYIHRFDNLKVVAVTGSSGKTTTKEILGSILQLDRPTLVTEGNYNSETGLPLTVFRIESGHKIAILEMGMSRPGEIKALVDIINPFISIITNIGSAHIGYFGTRDKIAEEKKSAFVNFTGDNVAIIPMWDDYYTYLKNDVHGRVLSVSDKPDYISEVKSLGFNGWIFLYEGIEVHYPYIGHYNLLNAYIAISCARELGIPEGVVAKGLESLPTMFGRGEILSGKNKLIRDCYNANPYSTLSSLELLNSTIWEGDKIPIIGSMLELGKSSYDEHLKIAKFAVEHFSKVILFGEEFEKIYELFKENSGTLYYSNMEALKDGVINEIEPGSLVLLKASRGVKLEEITKSLI